jgi:hypothetical protein
MPRDLPLLKEKFVMISFRSVADFKKHLLSAHKDAEKICIYDGCNWSCSKQATYKECLCATQKLTLKKNSSLEEGLLFGYCTFYYFNGQFQSTINNQN